MINQGNCNLYELCSNSFPRTNPIKRWQCKSPNTLVFLAHQILRDTVSVIRNNKFVKGEFCECFVYKLCTNIYYTINIHELLSLLSF